MEESKYNDIVAAKIKEISADMQAQRNDLDGAFAEYNLIRNQYLLKVRKLADKIFTEGENGAYIPSWKEKVYLDPQKLVSPRQAHGLGILKTSIISLKAIEKESSFSP